MLSACLPEDKDPNAMAQNSAGAQEAGGFYGAALGNIAMQLQNLVVSDPNWFVNMTDAQELNLAALGVKPEGIPADIKSHMCKTDTDTQWMQVTWIDGRDSANNFALKGIGDNGAMLMSTLRARLSGDQLGTALGGNRLAMSNDTTSAIPAQCGALNIPIGAPVITFLIDQPATPTTTLSRTEYRSVDCNPAGTLEVDKTMTGTKVQKRTVNYDSTGQMTVTVGGTSVPYTTTAGWQDDALGECINAVKIAATTTSGTTGAGSSVDTFASMAVVMKDILSAQIRSMDCRKSTVTASNLGDHQSLAGSADASIDTCANGASVTGKAGVEEGAGAHDDTDEKTLSCKANLPSTWTSTIGGLPGTFPTSVVWSNYAILIRDRTDKTVAGQEGQIKVDRWIGKQPNGVFCDITENLDAGCQSITGAPSLYTRSPTKIATPTIAVDRDGAYWGWSDPADGGKDDLIVHSATGVYQEAVQFRGWGWGRLWNCSAAWAWSWYYDDCMYAGIMYTNYFNGDYYKDTTGTVTDGVHAEKPSESRDWADRYIFKPKVTTVGDWDLKTVACEWGKREATAECPSLMPLNTAQGTWNPYVLTLGSPTPKAVLGKTYSAYYGGSDPQLPAPYGSGGGMIDSHTWLIEQMNRQFNLMVSQGHFPRLLQRPYHKYTNKACFLFGDCSTHIYNDVYIGPGTDTNYLKAWYNTPSAGVQTTLLNTDGVRRKYIAYEKPANSNNIVVEPVTGLAGYVDPVHCGQGKSVSETRYHKWTTTDPVYATKTVCDFAIFGFCIISHTETYIHHYDTVHHSEPVTITGSWIQEWRSDIGWSKKVEHYISSPNFGTWSSYGAIPASF
ncbi:MAG TPA: hypothetical protein VIN59_03400 [Alphaproteobacteria bacterium]